MSNNLFDAGLAHGFCGRQRAHHSLGARPRENPISTYGAFTPIQVARTAALNGPDDCVREMRAIYKRRRDVLVESFKRAGWDVPAPRASMFAWAPIPELLRPLGSGRVRYAPGREGRGRGVRRAQVSASSGEGFVSHRSWSRTSSCIRQGRPATLSAFLETASGKVAQRGSARQARLIARNFIRIN